MSADRPTPDEHAPWQARYIALVPDGDITATLAAQARETAALLRGLSAEQAGHRYAPGKWSVREVLGHMIDAERVFAYRALSFARGDQAELPGFEEDDWVREAGHERCDLRDLVDDYETVRAATLTVLRRLDDGAWARTGLANGVRCSVRALVWVTAGHERHHLAVLRERYLR
jgi:uncharacterized damage-inducible protein DinB